MGKRYVQHSDMCGCDRCAREWERETPGPIFDAVEDPNHCDYCDEPREHCRCWDDPGDDFDDWDQGHDPDAQCAKGFR